jgi:deoxyribonuclease V
LPIKLSSRFSIEKAHAAQLQLSKQLIHEDLLPETVSYVAGVDVAYAKGMSIGTVAVLDFASLTIVESRAVCVKTRFPYIPTLLSYREIPPALLAIRKLQVRPDVFLVDGQGFAHPYRLGFASHLGLIADVTTIGVAKRLLCGEVGPFTNQRWAPIKEGGELVGAAVISRIARKPIYVSVGHRVSLKRAISIVTHCTQAYRIPEPIRKAHLLAGEIKRKIGQEHTEYKKEKRL